MDRRRLLQTLGATGLAGLAGCGGSGGVLGSPTPTATPRPEPADLSEPELSAPEEVAFDETFTVEVAVSNAGDLSDEYEATIRSVGDTLDVETEVSMSVPGGETATAETDPISPPAAGEYRFELVESADEDDGSDGGGFGDTETATATSTPSDEPSVSVVADVAVAVRAAALSAGETIELPDGVAITVESVDLFTSAFIADGDDLPDGVFTAPTGRVLAAYRVAIENRGTESVRWNRSMLRALDGDVYDDPPDLRGYDGAFARSVSLSPSEGFEGYVLAQFPTDVAEAEAPMAVSIPDTSDAQEYVWSFEADGTRSFPQFELEGIDAPESTPTEQPYDIVFSVTNTGSAAGTFRGLVEYESQSIFSAEEWPALTSLEGSPAIETEIEAGATADITVTNVSESTGEYTYRIQPFGEEWTTTLE
ncbi:hypothetical protein Hbl1158_08520 [Halobaculum sp. CBA1158]|uniref:hypothetical protein n=1 Tax=Halobaculum sp. CBA1158 TaxID=2904243 RepID=UPI001F1AC65E|nr:hypothetical protein [Halobaculum sp. CBA1158]UIO98602.1 hypothetical protein Hbl1158_08520 [Halobaculum sp. CBA1158]